MPFVAGVLEFVLCAMMFLMAAFALTGYLVVSYNRMGDVATTIESYIGFVAVVAFVFGLAGSISAMQRWSLSLSVFGASWIAFWGLLQIWYSLTWIAVPSSSGRITLSQFSDVQIGVTLGTFALFLSMLVIMVVVASKEYFKPHALTSTVH